MTLICVLCKQSSSCFYTEKVGLLSLLYLGGVAQVLGEDVTHALPLSDPLPQVGQLTSLSLNQRVVVPAQTANKDPI